MARSGDRGEDTKVIEDTLSVYSDSKAKRPESKYWGFTLWKFDGDWDLHLQKMCNNVKLGIVKMTAQEEECPDTKKRHIQGAIVLKGKKRNTCFGWKDGDVWWQMKNKYASVEEFLEYSCKKDTRVGKQFIWNHTSKEELLELCRPNQKWQFDLLSLRDLSKKPSNIREIIWIYSYDGGTGKSSLARYIFMSYNNCIILSGKASDMKNGIISYVNMHHNTPNIVIIDVPRTCIDYISYTGLEEIKNMFFFSGKYEGGFANGYPPHLIVFANEPPQRERLSSDRWAVFQIEESGLVAEV